MAADPAGSLEYEGQEVETYALAVNWTAYVRAGLAPFIVGDVA